MKLMLGLAALGMLHAAGCGDDGGEPPIDAAMTVDAAIDAPPSNACTGQLYDLCSDNTQCASNNCRMFNNLGVSLCTQACTPGGTACPTQGSAAVECVQNSMVCRPAGANACTLP